MENHQKQSANFFWEPSISLVRQNVALSGHVLTLYLTFPSFNDPRECSF